uniref:Olfactory receptor n=1 Tax=Sphenodon punctatus TaxID=8508 RepID=A0A8D0HUU1_SPHPU
MISCDPKSMTWDNGTMVTQFILVGLTDLPELQVPLFVLFLVIYIITVVGNLGMIMLIRTDHQLQTPMYFFLSHLSVTDLCYSSVFSPKMLATFFERNQTISYTGCITQNFVFILFVTTEGFLLTAMAYDRYIAICNPLLYTAVMTKKVCINLTSALLNLTFCGPNIINHYFCDFPPLMKLACSDTRINQTILRTLTGCVAIITLPTVIISYLYILSAILKIGSTQGRHKAFSTCTSHLTAITVFFGSGIFSYILPSPEYTLEQKKISAMFYTLVIPMLNPLIYSLRNEDVKNALRRILT